MTDKPKPKDKDYSLPMAVFGRTLQRLGAEWNDPRLTALGKRTEAKGHSLKQQADETQPPPEKKPTE